MNRMGSAITYKAGLCLDGTMAGPSAVMDLPKDHRMDPLGRRIVRIRSGGAPGMADGIDGRALPAATCGAIHSRKTEITIGEALT